MTYDFAYDFAYDFETLPTFGGVFDFRLYLRLSTFEKISETAYDFLWHSLAGTGWLGGWYGLAGGIGLVFGFSLVGLLKSPKPLKIKAFRAAGGLFRSVFRFSLFYFPGLYMLFSGLVIGLKSFLAVLLNKNTPGYYTRLKSPKKCLKTQGIFSAGFRGCF